MLIQLVTGQAFNIKKTSGSWYKENSFKEKLKASPDFQEIDKILKVNATKSKKN
jgi:hypothetical protein